MTGGVSASGGLEELSDIRLLELRVAVHRELKRRGLALSVGEIAERLVIEFFNMTPGLPNLKEAARGTANVDALSRRGHRYSIKGGLVTRKTGTIYPDADDPDRQLFEYLLIARLNDDWTLSELYELTWAQFLQFRSWDKRMSAWYIGLSARTLTQARRLK